MTEEDRSGLKLIRGVGRDRLERLTDDLFENMDKTSRDNLVHELVMYRDNNFSTLKYDTLLAQFDTGGKMLRDFNPHDLRVDPSEYVSGEPTGAVGLKDVYD